MRAKDIPKQKRATCPFGGQTCQFEKSTCFGLIVAGYLFCHCILVGEVKPSQECCERAKDIPDRALFDYVFCEWMCCWKISECISSFVSINLLLMIFPLVLL